VVCCMKAGCRAQGAAGGKCRLREFWGERERRGRDHSRTNGDAVTIQTFRWERWMDGEMLFFIPIWGFLEVKALRF
jgi:hypothetical protein